MDAAVLYELGTPRFDTFREPTPEDDGHVVVDVRAAGLNPVDLNYAQGRFAAMTPALPSVAGREGVGTADGRRVYFVGCVPPFGSMAERTLVARDQLFDVPDGVDDATAVALGIAGMAAWLPLSWRAQLRPGERVLVLGATGALGTIAVQAARLLGAGRVVAAGRNPAGLRLAAERGADAVVDLTRLEGDELVAALREAAGGPIDVTVDPLWGAPTLAALRAMAPLGRLVQVGNSAGPTLEMSAVVLRPLAPSILYYHNGIVPEPQRREAYASLTRHAAAGELVVDVETLPLRDVATAWERQAQGSPGKLVLVP